MNKRKYTFIQYFFWLFAGSEIHILRTCETDYNRHARMGFILFMVTTIAAFAGGLAGYTFSGGHWQLVNGSYQFIGGSMSVAIIVGLIWGLLIFGIDSNMVTTIKKDPNNELQKWGSIFWSRAIIGLFIAAFISIPLEILIFHEDVLIQMEKDKVNQVLDMKTKQTSVYDLKDLDKEQLRKEEAKRMQDSITNQGCDPCNAYKSKQAEVATCNQSYESKKATYNRLNADVSRLRNNGTLTSEFYQKKGRLASVKSDYLKQGNECNRLRREAANICATYKDSLEKLQTKADSALAAVTTKKDVNTAKVDSITKTHSEQLSGLKGFTRQFVALEHASHEDWWVFVLLWLVRLIFIGFEILPTYTKLSTPIGDYDRAIYNRELAFKETLSRNKEIHDQSETERVAVEVNRNKQALKDMADAEDEVAKEIIAEWKRQELSNIQRKVSQYRNS